MRRRNPGVSGDDSPACSFTLSLRSAFWRGGPGQLAEARSGQPHALTSDEQMSTSADDVDEGQDRQGGRPRKDPADRRSHTHGLRLSPTEKAELEERAERAGLSMSEYIRRRALGKRVKSAVDEEAVRQMQRVGVNLNQIARRAHQQGVEAVEGQALSVVRDLREVVKRLQ
jgi:predicted HicB family RNase H-like nuclease